VRPAILNRSSRQDVPSHNISANKDSASFFTCKGATTAREQAMAPTVGVLADLNR
jgi:hypothetical protein